MDTLDRLTREERHQIFAIAKLKGQQYYRSLASVNYQGEGPKDHCQAPGTPPASISCASGVPQKSQYRVSLVRSKHGPVPISAFRDKDCELEVVDLKRFLELTAPEHAGDLDAVLSDLTAWAQTDRDLVSKLDEEETISTLRTFAEEAGRDQ